MSNQSTGGVSFFISPTFLLSMSWGIALFLSLIFSSGIDIEVLIVILIFFIFFHLGILFSKIIIRKRKQSFSQLDLSVFFGFFYIFLAIDLLYVVRVVTLSLEFGMSFLYRFRISIIDGDPLVDNYFFHIGILQITFGLGLYLLVSIFINKRDKSFSGLLAVTFLSLAINLLDGSRSFFMMGVTSLIILLLHFRKIKIKQAVLLFLLVAFLFVLSFSLFRGTADGLFTGLNYLVVYISGGIKALNHVLDGQVTVYWSDLMSLNNKAYNLGISPENYDLSDAKLSFVEFNENYQTNVFTALGVYLDAFGSFFVVYVFFFGFLSQYFYYGFVRQLSSFKVFSYLIMVNAVLFSIFHDYTVSLMYYLFKVYLVICVINIITLTKRMLFEQH